MFKKTANDNGEVCVGYETVIRRTRNVRDRLISSGHYATSIIKTQMNPLNDEWQCLTRLLDNRTNILPASLQFHQKADEVSCTSTNMKTSAFINR